MVRFGSKPKKKKSSKKGDTRRHWHKTRSATLQPSLPLSPTRYGSIPEELRSIERLRVEQLPSIIQRAAQWENVPLQHRLIDLCLRRLMLQTSPLFTTFEPRYEQVRTLRRLIFGKGDTLLIARTGFGKSLIFHAYSVLTGKITLQIIPLK